MDIPIQSHRILRRGHGSQAALRCLLTYEDRFLRRKVLHADSGEPFLVDLAQTTSLDHGDAFVLRDGRLVEVIAAAEPLLEVRGADLVRIAWHVGNRHTPCQIETGRLLIQRDHVMRDMLGLIGALVTEVEEPFTPEGGAYGHGRTHGHDHGHGHGPDPQSHHSGHDHDHHHDHDHGHHHDHGDAAVHDH